MALLLQVLVEEDFGYRHEGSHWGRSLKHNSLVVNEETQRWYWNSHDIGGNVLDYLIKVRKISPKSAKEILKIRGRFINGVYTEEEEVPSNSPSEGLVDIFWTKGKDNRNYWYTRKLKDSTIDRHRLGFSEGWYTIPLYSVRGVFENFQCRRDIPNKAMKYWYAHGKPSLINSGILDLVDTIYMTEGTVDAILLNQEGIPSVAQTGGAGYWNNEWFPLFNKISTIYYIADNDAAGRFAASRIANNLGVYRTKIYEFQGKPEKYDTVDYFRDGGSVELFREAVQNDSKYLFETGETHDFRRKNKSRSNRIPKRIYY